jgi:hypothetical protein
MFRLQLALRDLIGPEQARTRPTTRTRPTFASSSFVKGVIEVEAAKAVAIRDAELQMEVEQKNARCVTEKLRAEQLSKASAQYEHRYIMIDPLLSVEDQASVACSRGARVSRPQDALWPFMCDKVTARSPRLAPANIHHSIHSGAPSHHRF